MEKHEESLRERGRPMARTGYFVVTIVFQINWFFGSTVV
jgi:hypothetical protein